VIESLSCYRSSRQPSFWKLPRSLLSDKPHHGAVNEEVINPSTMISTIFWNTYIVFCNLHMLWMCMCMTFHDITTALVGQAFGSYPQFWLPSDRGKPQHSAVDEDAINPFKITPTSMSNTYVLHDLHMMWMHIHMSPAHISAALVSQASGSDNLEFWMPSKGQSRVYSIHWGGYQPIQFQQYCQNRILTQSKVAINTVHTWISNPSTPVLIPTSDSFRHRPLTLQKLLLHPTHTPETHLLRKPDSSRTK